MKNTFTFILLLIGCLFCFSQASKAQNIDDSNFERSFEVRLNKKNYLLGEPIYAVFNAKLLLADDKPRFLQESSIKVKSESEVKDFGMVGLITETPQPLPRVPFPFLGDQLRDQCKSYEREEKIERFREFFPNPGKYQIQFFLRVSGKKVASNLIDVTIIEPIGIDKEAFDFLSKHEGNINFYWVWTEENGLNLLEEFADKYSQSIYGDYAIQFLGNLYLSKGELDKARTEFDKIQFSENALIAGEAKKSLTEIARKKAELEKQPQ